MTYYLNNNNNTCFQTDVRVSAGSIHVRTWINAYYFPVATVRMLSHRSSLPYVHGGNNLVHAVRMDVSSRANSLPLYPGISHMYPPQSRRL